MISISSRHVMKPFFLIMAAGLLCGSSLYAEDYCLDGAGPYKCPFVLVAKSYWVDGFDMSTGHVGHLCKVVGVPACEGITGFTQIRVAPAGYEKIAPCGFIRFPVVTVCDDEYPDMKIARRRNDPCGADVALTGTCNEH